MAGVMDTTEDAATIFQEMCQKNLRPDAAIPRWEDLGYELGFSYGEIKIIDQNAIKKSVESCALDMLNEWKVQFGKSATPDKLIEALQAIELNSCAKQLQDALDIGKFKEHYPDYKIAKEIAPHWNEVGIQLGIKHLNNIKITNNPTYHKFKEMLLKWLEKQTCSKCEVYVKLYEALTEIQLNAPAEELKKKVNKVFNFM